MVIYDSAASTEHNKLGYNSRANFWVWDFRFPHFSPQKSLLNISWATSNLGQAHVPKVHQASSWDLSARFPGKNVVNDGWMPELIQNEQNC